MPLTYSGPLSTRMISGLPRHSNIWFRLRMTRSAGSEKSTSIAKPSRLKSSSTFKSRNALPSPSLSAIKSIDQLLFGASGTVSSSGFSRTSRLRGNPSYISRMLRLNLLAPDIKEAILNGTQPRTFNLQGMLTPFPESWEEQAKCFGFK